MKKKILLPAWLVAVLLSSLPLSCAWAQAQARTSIPDIGAKPTRIPDIGAKGFLPRWVTAGPSPSVVKITDQKVAEAIVYQDLSKELKKVLDQEKITRENQFHLTDLVEELNYLERDQLAGMITDVVLKQKKEKEPEKKKSKSLIDLLTFGLGSKKPPIEQKTSLDLENSQQDLAIAALKNAIPQAQQDYESEQKVLDSLYNDQWGKLQKELGADMSAFIRAACLDLSSQFRKNVGSPLTAMPHLKDDPECQNDLVAAMPVLKYCVAVTREKPNYAQALVALHEFAAMTNACLQADAARFAEEAFVNAFEATRQKADSFSLGKPFEDYFFPVVANFLLVFYEGNKHHMISDPAGSALPSWKVLSQRMNSIVQYESDLDSLFNQLGWWGYDRYDGGISQYPISPDDCAGGGAGGVVSKAPPLRLEGNTGTMQGGMGPAAAPTSQMGVGQMGPPSSDVGMSGMEKGMGPPPGGQEGGDRGGAGSGCKDGEIPQPCPGMGTFMNIALDVSMVGASGLGETAGQGVSSGCSNEGGSPSGGAGDLGSCIQSATGMTTFTEELFCAPGGGIRGMGGVSDPIRQTGSVSARQGGSVPKKTAKTVAQAQHQKRLSGAKGAGECDLFGALSGVAKEESSGSNKPAPETPPDKAKEAEKDAKEKATNGFSLESLHDVITTWGKNPASPVSQDQKQVLQNVIDAMGSKNDPSPQAREAEAAAKNAMSSASYTDALPPGVNGKYYTETKTVVVNDKYLSGENPDKHARTIQHEGVHAFLDHMDKDKKLTEKTRHRITGSLGLNRLCDPSSNACSCSALAQQVGNFNECFTAAGETVGMGYTPKGVCLVADGGEVEFAACGGAPISLGQVAVPGGKMDAMQLLTCMGQIPSGEPPGNASCWMIDCVGPGSVARDRSGATDGGVGDLSNFASDCCASGGAGGAGPGMERYLRFGPDEQP